VQKLRSIQVLRALAAIAVVFHHAYGMGHPHGEERLGAAGVDLFFVISGFIMAAIGSGRTPLGFLGARAKRILPLWWVALIPWMAVLRPDARLAGSSIFLWPVYGGAFHNPVLPVGWTLCFEMLFYVAFAVGLATRWWIPLGAFFLFFIAPGTALTAYLGSPMILEFVAGLAIAKLPKVERLGLPSLILAFIGFALSPVDQYAEVVGAGAAVRTCWWGIPATLTVYGALCLEQRFHSPLFNLPVFLGDASYSIYLFHKLGDFGATWPISLAVSLAIGVAAFVLIERRLLPSMISDAQALYRRLAHAVADHRPEALGRAPSLRIEE